MANDATVVELLAELEAANKDLEAARKEIAAENARIAARITAMERALGLAPMLYAVPAEGKTGKDA